MAKELLRPFLLTAPMAMVILGHAFSGCGSQGQMGASVSEPEVGQGQPAPDYFHADNDIAMTVRSLADALKVGEPLDSAEYDFEGVLTDGQGAPLYTDVQGAPGQWVVDVLDPGNVMIRNLYLGDLLPDDLETYLLSTLSLGDSARMDLTPHEAVDDDETDIEVYDLNGAYLRFEVRSGMAQNGIEGPLLSIVMSTVKPEGAGKRTSGSSQTGEGPSTGRRP